MKKLFKRFTGKFIVITRSAAKVFANLKIAPKLLIGFLIIALLSSLMGVYAIVGIKQVNDSSFEMYENILMPIKKLNEAVSSYQQQCISFRQALLAEEKSDQTMYLRILKNDDQSFISSLEVVEEMMLKEEAAQLDGLKNAYSEYQTALKNAIEDLEAGNKKQTITDLMSYGDLKSAESKTDKAINDLIAAATAQAAAKAAFNDEASSSVLMITIVAVCLVLILSVLIGVLTAKGLNGPIKKLTNSAKMLAIGDTNCKFADRTTKDEIGQLEDSFKTIVATIKHMEADTNMLIDAAKEGQLSVRADAEKHDGAYRKIIEGFNATLDNMIAPINESAEVLGALSEGNLDASVQGNFEGDFAIIKNALNSTIQTLKGYIGEVTSVMNSISQGVLTASIDSEFKGDFSALKDAINTSIDAFNGVLKDINTAAEEVAQGAVQLSGGSQIISQGAAEQASALEQLTATITEIADQTKNNAQSAGEASELSQKAKEDAAGGNEKMHMLQEAMTDINASSASISKIIKVIDDIAFQTNILALNAAVEAARAGAHGKGFAVVAEEVRNLAARSAKAAQETADLIEGSIGKTAAGTKIADEAAVALNAIVEGVDKTVTLSGLIATASNEQATGIAQVNKGIEQLSQVVQSSSATAQEAAASSEELAAQADQLKLMVGRFCLAEQKKLRISGQ